MFEDPQTIVSRVQAQWAASFAAKDWAALVGLYTDRPAFYGSVPELSTDRPALLAYFEALPPSLSEARYGVPVITVLGPDCFAASGEVVFINREGAAETALMFRMTHVLVRHGGAWLIAVHHASARPGPLLPG